LDLVLLRYAVDYAGGALDGLVVNCLDDLTRNPHREFAQVIDFARRPEIARLPASTTTCLAAQETLTRLLEDAEPVFESTTCDAMIDRLRGEIAPIAITATGPTFQDRKAGELNFIRRMRSTSDSKTAVGAI